MYGNLHGLRCYLAGSMEFLPDMGVGWREWVAKTLDSHGVVVMNPCDKPIDLAIEDIEGRERRLGMRRDGKWAELAAEMRLIRCVDLRMVDVADFLVVNLDITIPTCGTWEEIFSANRSKKPVLVRVEQGKERTPDWLLGTLPHETIFSSWMDLFGYLQGIDVLTAEQAAATKRWFIWNRSFRV